MQFLTSLFGGMGNTLITAGLALGVVLVLILLGLWALKWLTTTFARGGQKVRHRRLTLVDTLPIDARRRMVIVRRDEVEHLILLGGPADLVVESRIPAAAPPARTPASARHPAAQPEPERRAPTARSATPRPNAERPSPARPAAETPSSDNRVASIDRMRDVSHAGGERRFASLRHTGLLRPVSRRDPSTTENPRRDPADSVKQAESADQGRQADQDFDDSATNRAEGRVGR